MGGDNSHKYTFPRKFLSRLNPFHDHRYRQNTTIFSIHFYILDTFWSWQREWPSPCTARFMPRANPIGPACTLGETATTTLSHIHMRDRIKGNTYVSPVPSFSLSLSLSLSALRHRNISDDAGGSWLPVSPRQKGKKKICKRVWTLEWKYGDVAIAWTSRIFGITKREKRE